jgi:2-keto-4-pentenoate hydratase/2-oxohepta-3-ene-1,7-dioic acid hydratase in catechol pathway
MDTAQLNFEDITTTFKNLDCQGGKMKLTRFSYNGAEYFGFIKDNRFYSFRDFSLKTAAADQLLSLGNYLKKLPHSRRAAEEIEKNIDSLAKDGKKRESVKLLPITGNPPALIDFGLTPTHLLRSALGFIDHEFSGLKALIARRVIKKRIDRAMTKSFYSYYKGNCSVISGEGDTVVWPSYSAYLDIEPELAFLYGNEGERIAGYLIFNDLSARDVQFPELNELSLTRSKDFDNGIGSFLVTPDEVGNVRELEVKLTIGIHEPLKSDTSDYLISPEEVVDYLLTIAPIQTGTVVGMGTVPGLCSIERGEWIPPGEHFTIEFEKLGSLTQRFPEKVNFSGEHRWRKRNDLV